MQGLSYGLLQPHHNIRAVQDPFTELRKRERSADCQRSRLLSRPSSSDPGSPLKNPGLPVFVEPLEDCCVDEGRDIVLRGVVTGSQPIRVTWLHNGEQRQFTLLCLCDRPSSVFTLKEHFLFFIRLSGHFVSYQVLMTR